MPFQSCCETDPIPMSGNRFAKLRTDALYGILFGVIFFYNHLSAFDSWRDERLYFYFERLTASHNIAPVAPFHQPLGYENLRAIFKHLNTEALNSEQLSGYWFFTQQFNPDSLLSDARSPSNWRSLISQSNKSFLYWSHPEKGILAIHLLGNSGTISRISPDEQLAPYIRFGGSIEGYMPALHLSFSIRGYNGIVLANKQLALHKREFSYTYKLSETEESAYLDDTAGELVFENSQLYMSLGRNHFKVGYGELTPLWGTNHPPCDRLFMKLLLDPLEMTAIHAKLMGEEIMIADSIRGGVRQISEKYFAYHRFAFNLGRYTQIAAGEMVIYAERGLDLSYLNPFQFYKSAEHNNRDRDNTVLFLDFFTNCWRNWRFFAVFMLDDMNFSYLGTDWWGNKTLWHLGAICYEMERWTPLSLSVEYLRISPYFFSHRLANRNFSTSRYPLGNDIQPNSDYSLGTIKWMPDARWFCKFKLGFLRHGANFTAENDSLVNTGGDINLGHREFDSESARFLAGDLQCYWDWGIECEWEPIRNWFVRSSVVGSQQPNSSVFFYLDWTIWF